MGDDGRRREEYERLMQDKVWQCNEGQPGQGWNAQCC